MEWKTAGGAISWASKKRSSVALSSTEAEYMAQKNASTEAIWLRGVLKELSHPRGILNIIAVRSNIQYHYTRECIENGELELRYVPTEMIADGLTKGQPGARFSQFTNLQGLQRS